MIKICNHCGSIVSSAICFHCERTESETLLPKGTNMNFLEAVAEAEKGSSVHRKSDPHCRILGKRHVKNFAFAPEAILADDWEFISELYTDRPFAEIINYLSLGYEVYRRRWTNQVIYVGASSHVMRRRGHNDDATWEPCQGDFTATDWVIGKKHE